MCVCAGCVNKMPNENFTLGAESQPEQKRGEAKSGQTQGRLSVP